MPRSLSDLFPSGISTENLCNFLLSRSCYMTEKCYILLFDHPNNIKYLRFYDLAVVTLRVTAKEFSFLPRR
jgi:hypothetical protein